MFLIVALSTKDNVNIEKQLNDGYKRSGYGNSYQSIPTKVLNQGTNIYELRRASFQGVKRLFVIAYFIAAEDANNEAGIKNNRRHFLPTGEIENYNVLIYGRNFWVQSIDSLIKQYDEVRKVSTGKGDDYTTRCLLDYAYFNYRPITD